MEKVLAQAAGSGSGNVYASLLVLVIIGCAAWILMLYGRRFWFCIALILFGAVLVTTPGNAGDLMRDAASFVNQAPEKLREVFA